MIRPTPSTFALASALILLGSACKATPVPEAEPVPETESEPVQAEEPRPDVVFEAVAPDESAEAPEEAPQEARVVTPPADDELLDYYRQDSRNNIQAMEAQLTPLEVVKPKDGGTD